MIAGEKSLSVAPIGRWCRALRLAAAAQRCRAPGRLRRAQRGSGLNLGAGAARRCGAIRGREGKPPREAWELMFCEGEQKQFVLIGGKMFSFASLWRALGSSRFLLFVSPQCLCTQLSLPPPAPSRLVPFLPCGCRVSPTPHLIPGLSFFLSASHFSLLSSCRLWSEQPLERQRRGQPAAPGRQPLVAAVAHHSAGRWRHQPPRNAAGGCECLFGLLRTNASQQTVPGTSAWRSCAAEVLTGPYLLLGVALLGWSAGFLCVWWVWPLLLEWWVGPGAPGWTSLKLEVSFRSCSSGNHSHGFSELWELRGLGSQMALGSCSRTVSALTPARGPASFTSLPHQSWFSWFFLRQELCPSTCIASDSTSLFTLFSGSTCWDCGVLRSNSGFLSYRGETTPVPPLAWLSDSPVTAS